MVVPTTNTALSTGKYLGSAPWYRSYGYGSSDEDTESISVFSSDVRSKAKGPPKPKPFDVGSTYFYMGLKARNVNFKTVADVEIDWIKDVIIPKERARHTAEEEKDGSSIC